MARNLFCSDQRDKSIKDSLKTEQKVARRMEKRLKAIILRYNRDLIRPQTKVYEKNNTLHN